MDSNLFEILLIVFFIVSAIRSILSKKKKDNEQQRRQQSSVPKPEDRTTQKEESAKDIFEEMFGYSDRKRMGRMTKIPTESETEVLDPSSKNETSWNPEEEFEDSVGVETVRYAKRKPEQTRPTAYKTRIEELQQDTGKVKSSMERLPDTIEVEDLDKTEAVSEEMIYKIKKTLSNPVTIREYFLVSEILNKPKALIE